MMEDLSKFLILVAEDDVTTQLIAVNILRKKGYQVVAASDGQEAIDMCLKYRPQLILMDAFMPKIDGFLACKHIKQSDDEEIRNIPIVMVTALQDNSAIDKAFDSGAEDYITKPVNWHILEHRFEVLSQKIAAEKQSKDNEARFLAIAESANDAIISINHHGEIIFLNESASLMFEYEEHEVLQQSFAMLVASKRRKACEKILTQLNSLDASEMGKGTRQLQGIKKSGECFPAEFTLSAWVINGERHYSCILRDITDRFLKQEQIKKLSVAVEQSPNLVIMTDLEGVIEYVNPNIESITGYIVEEVIGKQVALLRSDSESEEESHIAWEEVLQGKSWSGTLQNKNKNGDLYWVKEFISPILDASENITHFIHTQEDVTEAKALAEDISYRATHDSLTGLINRYEFEACLVRLLRNSSDEESHVLCFIDLDNFKVVNDTGGHLVGDELLRQLGKVMNNVSRKQDVLARLGGDEFGLLLAYCDLNVAQKIAEKLQEIIRDFQMVWNEQYFRVGSSIGLVGITNNTQAGEALNAADAACYAAKNTGRNKIYVFRDEDQYLSEKSGEIQWVPKIERALERDNFVLYVQSINALKKGANKKHYEILLRLKDDETGQIIPPGLFLPAVERFHLAFKVDSWVIEHTLQWFIQNPSVLDDTDCFSINLSGLSLANEKLQDYIIDLIKQLNFPTQKIVFEITETAAINNLSQAQDFISAMQAIGIRFALDDFGSGLSSFAYLKNLSVEFLKIDGMFVKDIASDPIDRAMVKSIHEVAQIMGKETVAEFVENQAITDILQEIGIDYAQGYHYGKPAPLSGLLDAM